jgi:hypothetical protein
MRSMPDRVLVDHPPAPAFLIEQSRRHRADDNVLVGAVVDLVRVHSPAVRPGGFRGTGAIVWGPYRGLPVFLQPRLDP